MYKRKVKSHDCLNNIWSLTRKNDPQTAFIMNTTQHIYLLDLINFLRMFTFQINNISRKVDNKIIKSTYDDIFDPKILRHAISIIDSFSMTIKYNRKYLMMYSIIIIFLYLKLMVRLLGRIWSLSSFFK